MVGFGKTLSINAGTRINNVDFRYRIGIDVINRYRPVIDVDKKISFTQVINEPAGLGVDGSVGWNLRVPRAVIAEGTPAFLCL